MSVDFYQTYTAFPLGPTAQNIRLAGTANISSFTVVNQSNAPVNMFANGSAAGTPAISVAASAQVTLPIAQLPMVSISSTASAGSIYVHITDANIASLSSSVPTTPYQNFLFGQEDVFGFVPAVTDTLGRAITAVVFNPITLPARSAPYQFVVTDFAVSGLPKYVASGVFVTLGTLIPAFYTSQPWLQLLTGPGTLRPVTNTPRLSVVASGGAIAYLSMILTNYDSIAQLTNHNWSPVFGGYIQ